MSDEFSSPEQAEAFAVISALCGGDVQIVTRDPNWIEVETTSSDAPLDWFPGRVTIGIDGRLFR